MQRDRNGLEIVERAECLALLATVRVGRIGVSIKALPVILPVNFVLDADDSVVFRTSPGTKLDAAVDGAVLCFEADCFGEDGTLGWSVVVQGRAEVIKAGRAPVGALLLPEWIDDPHYVRIAPEMVSGRRLGALRSDRTVDLRS